MLWGPPHQRASFLEATRVAIGSGLKGEAAGGPTSLHGIRLPVATAVLTTLNPAAWPVIDRWAIQSLFSPPSPPVDRLAVYWQYLERLAELQRRWYPDATIHDVDVLAMRMAMSGVDPPFERLRFVVGP